MWSAGGVPQPDVDYAVVAVVAVPVGPFGIGQGIPLDLDGDLAVVREHDTDIGTAFVVGQPYLGSDVDHAGLSSRPCDQYRLAGQVPHGFGVVSTVGRRTACWVGEVRSALAGHAGSDDDGNPAAVFGIAESAHERPVTCDALVSEFMRTGVGRIRWYTDVLAANEIERDHDFVGGTQLETPLSNRTPSLPAMTGGLRRAALFEEI